MSPGTTEQRNQQRSDDGGAIRRNMILLGLDIGPDIRLRSIDTLHQSAIDFLQRYDSSQTADPTATQLQMLSRPNRPPSNSPTLDPCIPPPSAVSSRELPLRPRPIMCIFFALFICMRFTSLVGIQDGPDMYRRAQRPAVRERNGAAY